MRSTLHRRGLVPLALTVIVVPLFVSGSADASVVRSTGRGTSIDVSWTEYDPDDVLGLPGNVHIGYLYASTGPYGSFVFGSVSDFDCEEGETPWGGGHHVVEEIVDDGGDAVTTATLDAVEAVAESGGSVIDPATVIDTIEAEVDDTVTDTIADEFEEYPTCDYVQDRYLDGTETTTLTVDLRKEVAHLTGTLTVSNGGHGEPGDILGNPPVDITITGGEWQKFASDYEVRGETYRYTDSQKGTSFYGGEVTGRIGAMGMADDADDAAWGGYSKWQFRTVERIR